MHLLAYVPFVLAVAATGCRAAAKRDQQHYQIDQNLLQLQCEIMFCARQHRDANTAVTHACDLTYCRHKLAAHVRPGSCPAQHQHHQQQPHANWPPPAPAPAAACSADLDCPAAHKCCRDRRCEPAAGLRAVPLRTLPATPCNLTVQQELQQRRSAHLSYELAASSDDGGEPAAAGPPIDMRLMVEARMQPAAGGGTGAGAVRWGRWHRVDYRFTMWAEQRGRTVYTVAVWGLRPGRWYEFRTAMVGAQGTRGYSPASAPFQLREKPPQKLLAARNFTVVGQPRLQRTNGTVYARLAWRPPPLQASNHHQPAPVDRYRLSWQLRQPSKSSAADDEANSLAATTTLAAQTVPTAPTNASTWIVEPQHQHEFFDLRPNAEYVVHLQAFGPNRRTKSPVETLLLSTRVSEQLSQKPTSKTSTGGVTPKIHVRYFTSNRRLAHTSKAVATAAAPLIARIQWPPQWTAARIELEHLADDGVDDDDDDDDDIQQQRQQQRVDRRSIDDGTVFVESLALQPQQSSADFGALRWRQRYAVRLLDAGSGEWRRKEFRTPECSVYRARHPRVRC